MVLVVTTLADLQQRRLDVWDGYLGPGDEQFDEYLLREYTEAVDILFGRRFEGYGRASPRVVPEAMFHWSVGPFEVRLPSEPMTSSWPGLRPDDVVLFDLFSVVCPESEFVEDLDGVDDVRPDGVGLLGRRRPGSRRPTDPASCSLRPGRRPGSFSQSASRSASTTRAASAPLRLLWNGRRSRRPLTASVTGHSTGRAATRRPPSELCSGT